MNKENSSRFKILSGVVGLILFVGVMFILNRYQFNNVLATEIIGFLNNNFILIILMSIIFLITDMFYALIIPFSLPAPIFGAVGSLFIVTFIFRILGFMGRVLQEDAFSNISWLRWIVYPIVFVIVLISGYVSILTNAFRKASKITSKNEKIINITPKKHKTWRDVGNEFKDTSYDFIHEVRKNINRKKK